jgi:dihydrofolate reductase
MMSKSPGMKSVHLIAAIDSMGGIGKHGTLPWNFKEDMKYFKNLTRGAGDNAVIMGRKTFQSLNCVPLAYRKNIVLSRSVEIHHKYHNPKKGVIVVPDIGEALQYVDEHHFDDIWVIGGNQVYADFLNDFPHRIRHIYVTHITSDYDCDVFFPTIPPNFTVQRLHHTVDNEILLKFKIYGKE